MMRETTEIRKEQIKKALLEIIAEQGLHNVSTRRLAEKIGFSEGAIFRHFKTKRDIIKGIMDDIDEVLVGKLRDVALSPIKAEQKMFEYLCENVKYLKENRGVTILLFSEATHLGDKELKEKLSQILSEQKQFVIKIVKQGINEGVWCSTIDTEDFALIYMGIPITFNIEFVLNKSNLNIDNFCKRMFPIILKALNK
ncbi:TetR/AcrR family transcriptional regulator [Bacteroidetes/Chlorobi group bacterium ChocPot_Mid]|jgi:AcrR family transcriptional regulator|nr:MAG: TetR/AcrR family transcriptional regulator [Bacteroidetes/Chlorobi group bacterium ChocPot_Mid]